MMVVASNSLLHKSLVLKKNELQATTPPRCVAPANHGATRPGAAPNDRGTS